VKRPRWIYSLALATLLCFWVTAALAESPKEFVKGILDGVMTIQSSPASEADRSQQIHRIIDRSFDFPEMARDALGSASGRISGAQRQEFVSTFSYLFQDSYARMVLKFLKKENITYNRQNQQGNKARVDTTIVRPNESIPVAYLMRRSGGGWLLYDVNVDGVSILHNYRKQFSEVIRTKGFDFLLRRMKSQRQAIQ
jgi:phospholipid transport system substrate-binding protein